VCGGGGDDDAAGGGGDEAFLDGLVDEGKQRVVVAVHVQQAHRLVVDAQLSPGDHLKELLQCTIPTYYFFVTLLLFSIVLRIYVHHHHHLIRMNAMTAATWMEGGRS
jgi:hypothetical protein